MLKEEGEYALSKDVDVALWLDYRKFSNLPTLRESDDFLIVNCHSHSEFDQFKNSAVTPSISYLKMNSLLELYLTHFPMLTQLVVHKYGQTYLQLHRTQVDQLCKWTCDTQEKYDAKGPDVLGKSRLSM